MNEQYTMVRKVGGAGSQDEQSILDNVDRAIRDEDLAALVASGPGGPAGRATDLAIEAVEAFMNGDNYGAQFSEIGERFWALVEPFGKPATKIAEDTTREMHNGLSDGSGSGWVTMGPEIFMNRVYSHLIREGGREVKMVNPTAWLRRDTYGAVDLATSAGGLSRLLSRVVLNVVPGSPGSDSHLRTVPVTPDLRGYTDVTGMVVAEALLQQNRGRKVMYDIEKRGVQGILAMPPGLGRDPVLAPRLNVIEAGTLSAAGNNVVHPGVLDLLQQSDVLLRVKSDEPDSGNGTIIERHRSIQAGERIAGITLQQVVSYGVNDVRMEHQAGVVANVMDNFSGHNIPLVNVVTGYGNVTSYLTAANHAANGGRLRNELRKQYGEAFSMRGTTKKDGISIVTLVGQAMAEDLGAHASAVNDALNIGTDNNFDIGPYWPSPNSDAIYITVPTRHAARYACAAYDRFFGDQQA